MRLCLAAVVALLTIAAMPKRLWKPQLLRVGGLCALIFLFTAFGSVDMTPVLSDRSLPPSVGDVVIPSSVPDLGQPSYRYVVLRLGPFSVTKRSLGLASTIAGLTFAALQGASLALVTTPPERMALALGHALKPLGVLGVPVRELVLTVLLSLRFMAMAFDEARNLCLGIASRGIDWSLLGARGTIALALNTCGRLFGNLLARCENIAGAMTARGFRGPTPEALATIEAVSGGQPTSVLADAAAVLSLLGLALLCRFYV
jgi:energy-coupling factor transport system permease protein